MPVIVNTVYTKERLLRFNNYMAASQKLFWFIMAFGSFLIIAINVLSLLFIGFIPKLLLYLALVLLLDITYLFRWFVLPRFTLGKSYNVNAETQYTFYESECIAKASSTFEQGSFTFKYSGLKKIAKNGSDVYLFISGHQAYIVDISELSTEQEQTLKDVLAKTMKPKKFKW